MLTPTDPMRAVTEPEAVEEFRLRARAWLKANFGPVQSWDLNQHCASDELELQAVARDRALQRKLFDAGLAGICFPRAYGGQGLTPEHQRAFNQELVGYEFPSRFASPTFSPCAAVLLEFGSEEQKARHITAILKGEEFWVQMLSEPGGGSDVAGATTSAVRSGDHWILNGSKVWTSRAWWADWGLCLARTNWDVPKHEGLTVFMLPLRQPGVEIHRIERLNGESEACQEFFSDVAIPDSDRIGDVDGGWKVGTRWMYYERVGRNSQFTTLPAGLAIETSERPSLVEIASRSGALDDPAAKELIGAARALDIITFQMKRRLAAHAAAGGGSVDHSSIGRLFRGIATARQATNEFELAGAAAAAWSQADYGVTDAAGVQFLLRQAGCIGGGTTEIARNVISERVLGMPREPSGDRGIAFRDVPKGPKRA